MERSFAKVADDAVAGIGLIRDGAPATMKAFGSLAAAASAPTESVHERAWRGLALA